MRFDDFLLDRWLEENAGPSVRFDFGGSTGPSWRLREVLQLDGEEAAGPLLDLPLGYSRAAGARPLRAAIADMAGVPAEQVIVMTGAAECLTHVFLHAAEAGGNVVVPCPGYPAYTVLPRAFGLAVRPYRLDRTTAFRHDLDEIAGLVDDRTRALVVNVPHNPTGTVLTDAELLRLHDLAASRGIPFVCDEVHSRVFHGASTASATRLPHATTIGDFSKAFALPGLRLGWMIEPDRDRRAAYVNAREYVSISNSPVTEAVAEIAVRHRDTILGRTRAVAASNLRLVDTLFADNADRIGWIRPSGGMTGFPWLRRGGDARAFCVAALEHGLLLIPGDCFDRPDHFRIGFGAQDAGFEAAVAGFERFLRTEAV